jgi:hypothetical protein
MRADEPDDREATEAGTTAVGRAQQQLLRSVHQHLRDELAQIRGVVAQVADGAVDVAAARHLVNRLTLRQNYWTLGSFCAAYCRVVAIHHTIEDETMFPGLVAREPGLAPVIARLGEEHEAIAGTLSALDEALVAMVADDTALETVRERAETLGEQLLAHLAYEEEQLLPAIGRLTDRVV